MFRLGVTTNNTNMDAKIKIVDRLELVLLKPNHRMQMVTMLRLAKKKHKIYAFGDLINGQSIKSPPTTFH